MLGDGEICVCSHVRDEHYDRDPEMGTACKIEDCPCFYYEEDV